MTDINTIIAEREKTHGSYLDNATITWTIMDALRSGVSWDKLHPAQKETLHMIAHKMHRVVNGNPFTYDHWVDIEGYAHLIVQNWDELKNWQQDQIGKITIEEIGTLIALRKGDLVTVSSPPAQTALPLTAASPAPEPVGGPVDPSEGSPATVIAGGGGGGVAIAPAVSVYVGGGGSGDGISKLMDRISDELRFEPSLVKHPTSATHAEYSSFAGTIVEAGSMKGLRWSDLYSRVQGEDGRWQMMPAYVEEYGQ